jgi:transcriptional regulator with XRE-family HTH domain
MVKRTRPTVAQFIAAKINESGKSQIEVAQACGWPKPNMVTMVKQGKTRLPLDKIGPLAKILEVEPVYLFWLVMQEYYPDTLREIEDVIRGVMLNEHEREIIETYRDLTHGQDADVELHVLGDVGRALKGGGRSLIRWVPKGKGKSEIGLAAAA